MTKPRHTPLSPLARRSALLAVAGALLSALLLAGCTSGNTDRLGSPVATRDADTPIGISPNNRPQNAPAPDPTILPGSAQSGATSAESAADAQQTGAGPGASTAGSGVPPGGGPEPR